MKLRKPQVDKIVPILDGNDNMQTGKLAEALISEPLNMTDSIRTKVGNQNFPTHYRD